MIEINLLPEQMRRQKKEPMKLDLKADKLKIVVPAAVVGILIFLILLLSIVCSVRKKQIMALLGREQAISGKKGNAEKIDKEIKVLKARKGVLSDLTKRDFLWARKLNILSDMMFPGIWLTRIRGDMNDRLIIEGSVISKKEEAMAAVGKFMKNIRENREFFKDFNNIKLETVQRKSMDDKDVVDFRIALYF